MKLSEERRLYLLDKCLNIIDVHSLNTRVNNSPTNLIEFAERNYDQQLNQVVEAVMQKEKPPHFLLLAGPSASSKTTTANKLMQKLISTGINARVLSLDEFYKNREDLPFLENGDIDYETINTLDLAKLRVCLNELIEHKKSDFPVFDFSTGRRSDKVNPVTIDGHTVLIIEGLHALNPRIVNGLKSNEFIKLYICPTSDYCLNGEVVVSAREVRLMRRIIRDHFYRFSPIEKTMEMWINVVIAEVDSIIPFEKLADFSIDSTIIYEPCIYASYLFDIIKDAQPVRDIFRPQVEKLHKAATNFALLPREHIPENTVLREFLK